MDLELQSVTSGLETFDPGQEDELRRIGGIEDAHDALLRTMVPESQTMILGLDTLEPDQTDLTQVDGLENTEDGNASRRIPRPYKQASYSNWVDSHEFGICGPFNDYSPLLEALEDPSRSLTAGRGMSNSPNVVLAECDAESIQQQKFRWCHKPSQLRDLISKLDHPAENTKVRLISVFIFKDWLPSELVDAIGLALEVDPSFFQVACAAQTFPDILIPSINLKKSQSLSESSKKTPCLCDYALSRQQ